MTTEILLIRQSEARFSSLVQNSSDVVMVVEADSTIRYMSPSVERVLGHGPGQLEGTKLTVLIHPDDRAGVLQFLTSGGREEDAHPGLTEFRMKHRDDFWLHVETLRTNLMHDENVKGIVLNTRDVSERKAFEEQLQHQAFHDAVTGLANRALFKDRVEHMIERQARDNLPVSILFMDLDDFKTINDSLGHAAGDRMLAEVGERVKNSLRQADTAARLGGDEFAVLLEDGGDGVDAAEVAARILASLEGPFHLEGKEVFARASIGIATADAQTGGPEGAEELLRNADVAMYMAKEAGKGRYQVFEPAMHDTGAATPGAEGRPAARGRQRRVRPALPTGDRARDRAGRGSGGARPLAASHARHDPAPGLHPTGRGDRDDRLARPVGAARGVLAGPTAAGAIRDGPAAADGGQPLRAPAPAPGDRRRDRGDLDADPARPGQPGLGDHRVRDDAGHGAVDPAPGGTQGPRRQLAVDDFGTGYSSLNYIRRFPVDILKVDKSFVDGVNEGGEESALTAAIIELAGILRLRPVAEGIERADQLEKLLDLQCDLGQGYYFAKPLPLEAVDELLTTRQTLETRETELSS
jgi:diguanylate cyclase (GGDEF)-like protein/PAS domain S-box-containing protein